MNDKPKIIIYGGTFDPPHKGHFALIKAAVEDLRPSVMYVVPGLRSPFKNSPCAPFRDRVAMLKAGLRSAGLAPGRRVKIHPYEFERGRLTYTWQTVAFFRKKHPEAELYFLMGSDCLETFHRWKHYRRILESAGLVVGARQGFALKNPRRLPYLRLKGRFPLTASTELKAGLFAGLPQPDLFRSVAEYIERRGLYLAGLRRKVAGLMSPARFSHTLSVTRLALDLAAAYGADREKAAVAGLLHDAARDLGPRGLAAYAVRNRLKVPAFKAVLREAPLVLHSYAGADIAAKKFGVKDRETLRAIRRHTLGFAAPGLLEKIVYVADLACESREFPEAGVIRRLAFSDLDKAYAAANYVKLIYIFRTGGWPHPESVKVYNGMKGKLQVWNSQSGKNR